MHSGIGYMPKQSVLGGSIIMQSVFQNSFNIKDPSIMPSNSAYVSSVLVLLDCDCVLILFPGLSQHVRCCR